MTCRIAGRIRSKTMIGFNYFLDELARRETERSVWPVFNAVFTR